MDGKARHTSVILAWPNQVGQRTVNAYSEGSSPSARAVVLQGSQECPPSCHDGDRGFESRQDRQDRQDRASQCSYGEKEIMPAYEAGGGGSSPPGST